MLEIVPPGELWDSASLSSGPGPAACSPASPPSSGRETGAPSLRLSWGVICTAHRGDATLPKWLFARGRACL